MTDIAFTQLSEGSLSELGAVVHPMKSDNLATKDEAAEIRTGDEIVSAGLLEGASGEWRNYPIFKWGHVSSVRSEPLYVPQSCPPHKPQPMHQTLLSASLVPGNSGSPIVVLPNERHPGRPFIAGVQSISFIGSDVAGMASVPPMLDELRSAGSGDLDLGPPDAQAIVKQNR